MKNFFYFVIVISTVFYFIKQDRTHDNPVANFNKFPVDIVFYYGEGLSKTELTKLQKQVKNTIDVKLIPKKLDLLTNDNLAQYKNENGYLDGKKALNSLLNEHFIRDYENVTVFSFNQNYRLKNQHRDVLGNAYDYINTVIVNQKEKRDIHSFGETIMHEYGHVLGLGHCDDYDCIMHYSSLSTTRDFCPNCRIMLEEQIRVNKKVSGK